MKDTKISVFKDLFKSTDVPFNVTLEKVANRIKHGTSKELIHKIRQGNKELKKKLPSILFAGVFQERNRKGLQEHSGLMVVDFDKYPDAETMKSHLSLLKLNEHFVLLFISPGGLGIKGVVRIPKADKITHPQYFKAFHKKFNYKYFDIANSDVARVCFESYDPDIYINYNAKTFKAELIDEGQSRLNTVPFLPISDEDKIVDKIMKFNWQKDFRNGERNAFIFDIAGAFCEYGISQTYAENYIINNVIHGDFSERETITAINSAYRSRNANTKYFEDYSKANRIKLDIPKGKDYVINHHNIDEKTYNIVKEDKESKNFWYTDDKGKTKIESLDYKHWLESKGFKKYFPSNSEKPTWVQIESNIVKEISVEKIKDSVLTYLLEKGELDAWRLCVNYNNIFSEQYLLFLDNIELLMLKDTKTKSFIAFKNGILEITKTQVKLVDFIDINGYVWESQIINRNFELLDDLDNDYKTFINNISNNEPLALECVIGYLLSTYKNKMNNKAIILNDEVISDNPEGGTGKGLLIQGIKQIRKTSILDGKAFDDKKSFPYQTVSQDTQILVFDDVKKNFSFESKFSLVTEGITLERKNKDALKLSVEESPKVVISTNYAIKGTGNSHDRRRHEIEISQYYGKDKTPYDEFGKQLFDDWNEDEFLAFDNYMVNCIQAYLKAGLVQQTAKNIKTRKFIIETSMEFYEWVNDDDNSLTNHRMDKAEIFERFVREYPDYKKYLSRKKFNIWMKSYADYMGYKFSQGRTNSSKWVLIENKNDVEIEKVTVVPF